MKKKYITPDIEIVRFTTEDIITSSSLTGDSSDDNASTASLDQADTPQVNDFNEYFN
ncbi:MAG: hypothetical protein IKK42_03475 [Oscillospiraceae bacterium]|nr:hypothetical protein [Oscillospiraceae bacterium]